MVSKPESFSLQKEVVADRARRIGKPGHVVEIGAALRPLCIAYAVAGIRDCERAVSEEGRDAEIGACEADMVVCGTGNSWVRRRVSSVKTLVSCMRAVAIGVLAVDANFDRI